MRKPNHADAELLLRLYEIRRDPELRRARAWFLTEFKATTWAEIQSRYLSHDEADRYMRMTTSYWEMVGTLVNRGVLHDELFFDHTGEDIVTWERCKSWIEEARADIRPTYLYQFERMVAAHQEFRKRTIAEFTASENSKPAPRVAVRSKRRARTSGRPTCTNSSAWSRRTRSSGSARSPSSPRARTRSPRRASRSDRRGARGHPADLPVPIRAHGRGAPGVPEAHDRRVHRERELEARAARRGQIEEARADIRPTYLYQFERMVAAHQEFRKRTIAEFTASENSKPAPRVAVRSKRRARTSGRPTCTNSSAWSRRTRSSGSARSPSSPRARTRSPRRASR